MCNLQGSTQKNEPSCEFLFFIFNEVFDSDSGATSHISQRTQACGRYNYPAVGEVLRSDSSFRYVAMRQLCEFGKLRVDTRLC